ncbi:unnamed protein product, partial [Rotaria sp. Silwood2]
LDVLHEFLSQIGEIRYIRSAYIDENTETRGAYVEFNEQPSIPKVLSINGFQFFNRPLLVNHATSCVIKPTIVRELKSNEKDTKFSPSRSQSTSHHQNTETNDDSDDNNDHYSSSKSKSHKKSSKSRRSSKSRPRSRKRTRSRSSRDRKHRSRSSRDRKHRSRSKDRHHRSESRKDKKSGK